MTRPTASMLTAIQNTSLFDDVYQEDPTTNELEKHVASLSGKEDGVFVLSGTMGNILAIRSHLTQPPYSILCDHRAHIVQHEAGGGMLLTGAMVTGVIPNNGLYLTLEDIEARFIPDTDIHHAPTRLIALENTMAGTIMPLSEVKRISVFARNNGIKLHLDGARIWEAVVAGAGSLPDFLACFDSASLCFSKGLGAPIGSMLVGEKAFVKHARWIRKSIGGGLRQSGVVTAAARIAVDETFGKGPNGEGGLLAKSHINAKTIAQKWQALGGKLDNPTETNMVWLDLADAGIVVKDFIALGKEKGLQLWSGRLVVHYQITEEAVLKLEEVMIEVMKRKKAGAEVVGKERTYG
jgi:threonine aldolase